MLILFFSLYKNKVISTYSKQVSQILRTIYCFFYLIEKSFWAMKFNNFCNWIKVIICFDGCIPIEAIINTVFGLVNFMPLIEFGFKAFVQGDVNYKLFTFTSMICMRGFNYFDLGFKRIKTKGALYHLSFYVCLFLFFFFVISSDKFLFLFSFVDEFPLFNNLCYTIKFYRCFFKIIKPKESLTGNELLKRDWRLVGLFSMFSQIQWKL